MTDSLQAFEHRLPANELIQASIDGRGYCWPVVLHSLYRCMVLLRESKAPEIERLAHPLPVPLLLLLPLALVDGSFATWVFAGLCQSCGRSIGAFVRAYTLAIVALDKLFC